MFTKKESGKTDLDVAIDSAFSELSVHKSDSEKYAAILDRIVVLHGMKESEKPSSLSADTKAVIAANLAGILMIIGHEHTHVITTKAFSLLLKLR